MITYRQADYGTPLRTAPASRPGRYHRGTEAEPTQYLCLHPLGPMAELMRNHDLRTEAQVRRVQTRTWALEAAIEDLPEITFDNARDFGIEPAELVADDQGRTQAFAERFRGELPGVVVLSAALPGTQNAVLFGARVAAPYVSEPVTALDIPASVTAQGGGPLISLIELVRFKGEPHAALAAWERDDELSFEEPDWELTREHA